MKLVTAALSVAGLALGALILAPRPCGACSPPPPFVEMLELRFESIEVNGEDRTTPDAYAGVVGTFEAGAFGAPPVLRLLRESEVVFEATFR